MDYGLWTQLIYYVVRILVQITGTVDRHIPDTPELNPLHMQRQAADRRQADRQ